MCSVRYKKCCVCHSNIQYFERSRQNLPTLPIPSPPAERFPLRELLISLIGDTIEVFTPFGILVGTLEAVQEDYIILVDETNSQNLVRLAKIESVLI